MEGLAAFTSVFGSVSAIVTASVLIIRPLREKLLGQKAVQSGVKCLLRADMLHIYYKGRPANAVRQYERENFEAEYSAYKALCGNSFIDTIHTEVQKWEVLS